MKIQHLLAHKPAFVATIAPTATIAELLEELARHNIGALIVSPDGKSIAGIVSERDVVRVLAADAKQTDATELASRAVSSIMVSEVVTCTGDTKIDDVMALMTEARVRHVPVLDDDGMIGGIVSIGDVVKFRMGELEEERQALIEYVMG